MRNKTFDESFETGGGVGVGEHQRGRRHREHSAVTDFGNFQSHTPPPKDEADAEDNGEKSTQTKQCFRRFSSLMFSHLGTLIIVVLYVVMGGFLFNYLEVGNEISSCSTSQDKYRAKLYQTADLVYALSQGANATEAQRNVLKKMESFATDVFALNINPDFDCSSYKDGSAQPNWNIVNAAYFCVTIVATIGYGHISPATQWGQIVCIVYGIIGIPLMLLFLSKIGEPTAILFRNFYLNIFCCKCFVKRLPNESRLMRQLDEPREKPPIDIEDGEKEPPAKVIVVDDEEDEELEADEVVNIPIIVTIMLLAFYVIIGALIFRLWETWTLVEGAYFSFITLTTVGFGDYVPGRNGPFNSTSVIIELVVGCIYCIFGLALLSMCINLIQDEISAKFQWIGTKLGLAVHNADESAIDDETDEEDEEEDEESDDGEEEEEEDEEEDAANGSVSSTKGLEKKHQPPQLQRGRNGQAVESRA